MKTLTVPVLLAAMISVVLALTGCGSKTKAPEPLSLDRVPTELTQAFTTADPGVKEVVAKAVAAIEANRLKEASTLLSRLSKTPDLTPPQYAVVIRAMMGVNGTLQKAQATGG